MLLSEAARTGRKFRRKSDPSVWYWLEGKHVMRKHPNPMLDGSCGWQPDAEQLISNDWEAEPKKVEVTEQDLMDIAKTLSLHPITNQRRLAPTEFMKLVAEELGFKD